VRAANATRRDCHFSDADASGASLVPPGSVLRLEGPRGGGEDPWQFLPVPASPTVSGGRPLQRSTGEFDPLLDE